MRDFKSGARKTAEPRKPNDMGNLAQFLTDKDFEEAAEYFASMQWTPWIRVVEADTIKKTRVAGQMYHLVEDAGTEAPENEALEGLRSPRIGFVAYVPVGAIKKGEDLVTTGGSGKTLACGTCHGADLKGVGPIPGLANRSPSYLGRQIWDFKAGRATARWCAHEAGRREAHQRGHRQHPGLHRIAKAVGRPIFVRTSQKSVRIPVV
jgi:cytochrome c553